MSSNGSLKKTEIKNRAIYIVPHSHPTRNYVTGQPAIYLQGHSPVQSSYVFLDAVIQIVDLNN